MASLSRWAQFSPNINIVFFCWAKYFIRLSFASDKLFFFPHLFHHLNEVLQSTSTSSQLACLRIFLMLSLSLFLYKHSPDFNLIFFLSLKQILWENVCVCMREIEIERERERVRQRQRERQRESFHYTQVSEEIISRVFFWNLKNKKKEKRKQKQYLRRRQFNRANDFVLLVFFSLSLLHPVSSCKNTSYI